MRNKFFFIPAVCFSMFLLSCSQYDRYKLSETDIRFNPYSPGDTLIFQLDNSIYDTVIVEEILRQTIKSNPMMDEEKFSFQSLSVLVKHKMTTNSFLQGRSGGSILMISSYPESHFSFWFTGFDKSEAVSSSMYTKDLGGYETKRLEVKAGTFNDVIILSPLHTSPSHLDPISTVHWSKKEGYLKIQINSNHTWELVKKITVKNKQ
jgi:hypothetical protein